jgi:hypothetical protein
MSEGKFVVDKKYYRTGVEMEMDDDNKTVEMLETLPLGHSVDVNNPETLLVTAREMVARTYADDRDYCFVRVDPVGKVVRYCWCRTEEEAQKQQRCGLYAYKDIPHILHLPLEAKVELLGDRVKKNFGDVMGHYTDPTAAEHSIMRMIEAASAARKTHVYILAEQVPATFVPVLAKHFHVLPVGKRIGSDAGYSMRKMNTEEEYLRICWSSWGVASMLQSKNQDPHKSQEQRENDDRNKPE